MLKSKQYKAIMRPEMLYKSKFWSVNNKMKLSMSVTCKIKMLSWLKYRNEYYRGQDKMV